MISLHCGRRCSIALKIAGIAIILLCIVLNKWFCEAYLFPFHTAQLKVLEPLRIHLRMELLYKFQALGILTGLVMVFWNSVVYWTARFARTRVGRLLIAPPNYRCVLALAPLMLVETIYWAIACYCDQIPWLLPLTVVSWINSLVISALLFLLVTVTLTKVLQFRYMPLVLALIWATVIVADALLFWYGNTRFEIRYWGLATSDSLPGFVNAGTISFLLTVFGLCLASGALLIRPVAVMTWAASLRIAVLLAIVYVVNIPYQVLSIHEMTVDARIPSTPGVLVDHYRRLKYIGQDPVLHAGNEFLFKEHVGELTNLNEFQSVISHYSLPLGQQRYEPLAARPPKRIIVVFCESLSSFFLKSCNPELPETITPFLDSPWVQKSLFRDYHTSAQPTLEGLAVTFCSHPNPYLLLQTEMPGSFIKILRDHGWHTVFFSSATKYFGGKGRYCAEAGIQDFFGAEALSEDPEVAKYRINWGVCDRILYQQAKDYIAAHRDEPLFVVIEGADTHVPEGRTNYGDLKYPDAPEWIQQQRLAGFMRSVFRTDYDLKNFVEGLKAEGLWDEDTLLIITADHCFQACPVLKTLPGTSNSAFERIPLFMITPLALPPADRDRATSQLDVAPSLLHLLGLPIPQGYWGKSLFDPRPNDTPFVGIFRNMVTITNQHLNEHFDLHRPDNSMQKGLSLLLRLYYKGSGNQEAAEPPEAQEGG